MFLFNKKNVKKNKEILIFGAGLSGLYIGIGLLLKGYKVTIVEKNNEIGGKLTYYNQYYPYMIDDYKLLISQLNDINIVLCGDIFKNINSIMVINNNKEKILIPNRLDDFLDLLLSLSTNDEKKIYELITLIKQFSKTNINKNYYQLTINEYISIFKSNEIKTILSNILPLNLSLISLIKMLNNYFKSTLKVLNTDIVKQLSDKFYTLGGKISFGNSAENIAFSRLNYASHVVLEDKSIIKSDYFINTIDPNYLYNKLLNNKYHDRKFSLRYENKEKFQVDSRIIMFFSIDKELECDIINIEIGQLKINSTYISSLKFYKSLNKNIIICEIPQSSNDFEMYKIINNKIQQNINNKVVEEIVSCFYNYCPNYKIKLINIINPIDIYNKYNSYQGSLKGFLNTPINNNIIGDEKINGIHNVINCSSWLSSVGGINNSLLVSKHCLDRMEKIIRNEK